MKLTKKIKEKIKQHALEEKPHECCGLIVSNNKSVNVIPCINAASSPEKHFKIPAFDYVRACSSGTIEAIYHSHPDGPAKFSLADEQNYNTTKERFILYSVKDNKFCDSLEEENNELLGRRYKIGVSDCMSLFRDYYVNKFKRKMTYAEIWPSQDYYFDEHGKADIKKVINRLEYFGFSLLEGEPPKAHDLIVTKARKHEIARLVFPCHLCIHVGHGKVLIQTATRKSGIVDYEPVIKKNLLMILRPNFV